jgi:hypothetical protein
MPNNRTIRIVSIILLVSVFSFCAYVGYHSSFYSCVNQADNTYSAQHQNAEHQTVSVPFLLGYASCANRVARHDGEAITALSTALLTFVTLGLVPLAIEQSDTTRAQLRAYVLHEATDLIDGTGMTAFVDRSGQPGMSVSIKNYGQTPAYAVKHYSWIDVALIAEANRMVATTETVKVLGSTTFGPQGSIKANRWFGRSITEEERAGILAGRHAIFCYGRIEYLYAWKRPQWATYRLQYSASAWPPIGTKTAAMNFSRDGNDASV